MSQPNNDVPAKQTSKKPTEKTLPTQCRTIGIALIVETIGHGAKLVFRYPAGPSNNDTSTFYTLPSRTMEKLFRPKEPHCGRPITLTLGYTIFCCWAISLNDVDTAEDPSDNKLILFSVIVALIPETSDETLSNKVKAKKCSSSIPVSDPIKQAIQNAHLSLSRLCRILHREEERCEYITHESSRLLKLKEEYKSEDVLDRYNNSLLEVMMMQNAHQSYGNLVRDFAQVFHKLSSDTSDGIVYINNHVGVSIEPVVSSHNRMYPVLHKDLDSLVARPYHTLLLKRSSDDIITNLNSNAIGPHQYLSKLILSINPYKSLADIAIDAVIPLPEILYLASQLVDRGIATVSNVISLSSQYVCNNDGTLLQNLALKFAQRFGTNVPIGIAISVITTRGSTLGAILSNLHSNVLGVRLQTKIQSTHEYGQTNTTYRLPISSTRFPTNTNTLSSTLSRGDAKKDIVCSMVAWLRAHEAIV